MSNRPVVTHATNVVERRKVSQVIERFAKQELSGWVNRAITSKFLTAEECLESTPDNLLNLRRKLVKAVEEGMLERKDQEEKIAGLAALIWWHRQEEDKQWQMMQEW